MTARNVTQIRPAKAGSPDETMARILAYLDSLGPIDDADEGDDALQYVNGRALVIALAKSAIGKEWPTLRLTLTNCADLLFFIHNSEPVRSKAKDRRQDPRDTPSDLIGRILMGRMYVMETVERTLRGYVCGHADPMDAVICLSQAIAVLDLVTESLSGTAFPNLAESHTIGQCVYSAIADIKRARDVLDPDGAEGKAS